MNHHFVVHVRHGPQSRNFISYLPGAFDMFLSFPPRFGDGQSIKLQSRDCTVPPQCLWFAHQSSFLSLHLGYRKKLAQNMLSYVINHGEKLWFNIQKIHILKIYSRSKISIMIPKIKPCLECSMVFLGFSYGHPFNLGRSQQCEQKTAKSTWDK